MDRLFSLSCAVIALAMTSSGVQASEAGPTTCTVAAAPVNKSVTVDEYTLQASFKCASGAEDSFLPSCQTSTDKCCCKDTGDCPVDDQKAIKDVLGTKGHVSKGSEQTYTVTIDGLPADRGNRMYYICRDARSQKCTVTVELPKKTPTDKDCALDRSLQFRITEAAKSLHFVCKGPSGTRLLPASGNGCADVKQVAAKYATAEFPEGEVNGSDDPITIRFSTLPEKTLKLCYQCQYPNPTASQYPDNIKKPSERPCNVEISVDAAEATPSKTTTAQTTNSEAGVFPGLGLVSTLAVALVGAAGA